MSLPVSQTPRISFEPKAGAGTGSESPGLAASTTSNQASRQGKSAGAGVAVSPHLSQPSF